MLWGWHHPCGCKFGRGLGRREVGGCFGLAPPLRVQGRQAAARIRQTRVSVWAIPGGKMGGVAPEDGRDRNAKPPMLQRAFLRPLRGAPRGVCGIAAGRPPMGGAKLQTVRRGSHRPTAYSFFFRTPEKGCICGKITQKGGVFHFPSPRIRIASETKNRVKGRCFYRVLSRVRMRVRVKCGIIAPIERIFQDGRKCSGNPGKRYAFDLDQC